MFSIGKKYRTSLLSTFRQVSKLFLNRLLTECRGKAVILPINRVPDGRIPLFRIRLTVFISNLPTNLPRMWDALHPPAAVCFLHLCLTDAEKYVFGRVGPESPEEWGCLSR